MPKQRPTTNDQRITIAIWLQESTKKLQAAPISSARLDALLLLEHILERPRNWLFAHSDKELSDSQLEALNKNILQRKSHLPVAYITGSKEFYGRDFFVNEAVLIPRPESEIIIEILKELANSKQQVANRVASAAQLTILDIGTGSGCLAITAKLEIPESAVIATDISGLALKVAKKNAQMLHADVEFYQSDLFSKIQDLRSTILLANLPYVPEGLITSEEITKEPAEALFSGTDGLKHYRRFWQQVSTLSHLQPSHIITESLKDQHQTMIQLAKSANYTLKNTKDLIQHFQII